MFRVRNSGTTPTTFWSGGTQIDLAAGESWEVPEATNLGEIEKITDEFSNLVLEIATVSSVVGALSLGGEWDADGNSPDLSSASPDAGDYYIVTTAGTNSLTGSSVDWTVGDWAVYDGSAWFRIPYPTASTTVSGLVELSTTAEVTGGSSATTAVTPDALAGSALFGVKRIEIPVFDAATAVSTGDGAAFTVVSSDLVGMNVVDVYAVTGDAGDTGTTDVVLRKNRGGVDSDVTSTAVTIADGEQVANDGVIDTDEDDLAENDILYVDVDAVHTGTAPNGLVVVVLAQLP